jgi:site-specific DNA-adenine methylase
VDRVSWYITKISASWGSFRENPTPENMNRFIRTVNQVSQRVGIPAGDVIAAAEYFYKVRSEKAKAVVNEAVKRFIARIVIANTAHFASVPAGTGTEAETAEVKEVKVEIPKEIVESIQVVRDQIAAIQREIEYIREQVRQRKGFGARAIARGEKRIEFKEGNMYWMIREIMRQGGEWTKEEIVEEIRKRFNKEVSGNSVSGRISEMAAAGYIAGRREGRTWYWRWTSP